MPVAPRTVRRAILLGAAIMATLLLAGWALIPGGRAEAPATLRPPADRPVLGLFTSLPLYWAEAPDLAAMLAPDGEIHWARAALESTYGLRPLDTLEGLTARKPRNLLMVQPRPLSPAENVALDAWVRRGGRVLLFADPALTQDSAFALGDRRRPQDTVLLSPILTRWGVRLEFDEDQPLGERTVALAGGQLPVNLPGRLGSAPGGSCRFEGGGLRALCLVGKGRVTVIADAALFERVEQPEAIEPRRRALLALIEFAFR